MKILILSCNTGQGHNSCAAALQSFALERGDECVIADALSFISENTSEAVSKLHTAVYRKVPEIFDIGYAYCDKHPNLFKEGTMVRKLISAVAEPLVKYIRDSVFDAVICPHIFPALMLIGETDIKKYFLNTDYSVCPCVGICDCDGYFIPDESLRGEFIRAGVPDEKIISSGIPVHEKFKIKLDKAEAKRFLGIAEGKRHLLMACGSMGCGPLGEMAEYIENCGTDIHATIICGSNEKLRESLIKKNYSHVTAVGYTDKIPLYMDSADLYLTKPGGITVTESALKGTPLALINAVAGCETANYNFFGGHGAAICDDDPKEMIRKCQSVIFDDERLEKLSDCISRLAHPDACKIIYNTVKSGFDTQK